MKGSEEKSARRKLFSGGRLAIAVALLLVSGEVIAADTECHTLVDFGKADSTKWYVVNDGVMGGLSQSGIRRTEDATGMFTGVLSLENNGGFASVRALVGRCDYAVHDGLEIRVRGDGRTYQLRLRTDDRFDGVAYRAFFATTNGEWTTISIPFEEFTPTFRGRTLRDVPALDPARITQVGFMLADKTPGAFALEIAFVRTWESDRE